MRLLAFAAERAVVAVHGPDAASFLQGQLSQDLAPLAPGGATWSLLLDPQGKLVAILRVARAAAGDGDRFLLLCDASVADGVVERLERFKLRVKAEVRRLDLPVLVLNGDDGAGSWTTAEGPVDAGWPGQRCFELPGGEAADVESGSAVEYHRRRIEAGVPVVGVDVPVGALPHETSMVAAAVSFTKGCYTGQELVARVDSRGGQAPRRLVRVAGLDGALLTAGVELAVGGRITSVAGDLGLASVPRSVDVPGITSADGVEVVLEELAW